MFEELYKFISRLHYGIKFMPEKDFDERGCNPEVCNKYEKGNRNETKTSSKGK